jgi:hypothetical protein
MSVIKFETNKARDLVLQAFGGNGIFGKPEESKRYFEPDGSPQKQLRFSATEGPFYVSEFAGMQINDQLEKLKVQPGDRIQITKAEVPVQGKKAVTRWLVDRPAGAPAAPPATNGNGYHPAAKIPYNVFLREAIRETVQILKDSGEQWTDASKQGMVSTLVIQAGREGILSWSLPAEPSELERQLAASIAHVNERKAQAAAPITEPPAAPLPRTQATSPQAITKKPWSTFKGMLADFAALKAQIPWPLYYDVLRQFGVEHANQFQSSSVGLQCYRRLAERVNEYRLQASDPSMFQHYEAGEGEWA